MSVPSLLVTVHRVLTTMRHDLTAALKSRDRVAAAALRSALAAVENAGAVDVPITTTAAGDHLAGSVAGIGVTEVSRRELDESGIVAIVHAEVRERLDAADYYEGSGRPDQVERLRAEAAVLARYLPPGP